MARGKRDRLSTEQRNQEREFGYGDEPANNISRRKRFWNALEEKVTLSAMPHREICRGTE